MEGIFKKLTISILRAAITLGIIASLFLAACGPKARSATMDIPVVPDNLETTTGAINPDNKPYTSYGPVSETESIRQEVPLTPENKAFGEQIERATLSQSPVDPAQSGQAAPHKVEVALQIKGQPSPIKFQGQLQPQGSKYVGKLEDPSGQNKDVAVAAECAEETCDHAKLVVSDKQNHAAGIVITREERVLKAKAPADPSEAPTDATLTDEYKDGKSVVVTATEIYPGRSYYEITEKSENSPDSQAQKPTVKFSGDLVEPGGDCVPVQNNGDKIGSTCLIGNDEQGDLLFKAQPKADNSPRQQSVRGKNNKQPAVYLELSGGGRQQVPTAPVNKENCPVRNASTNILVQDIMKDCGNSIVVSYIKKYWVNARVQYVRKFLRANELRLQKNPQGTRDELRGANDLKTIMELLGSTKVPITGQPVFPEIWSVVTVWESRFDNNAVGLAGELGYWQIMAATGAELGLKTYPRVAAKNDERGNVSKATRAALKYYTDLLQQWHGDVKMALASYNRGGGSILGFSQDLQRRIENGRVDVGDDLREAYAISKDFWYIYRLHMTSGRNWEYVPAILAGMFVMAAPNAYGVSATSRPMEMR